MYSTAWFAINPANLKQFSYAVCFFSESCLGKAMVAYTKPRQWKEGGERVRGKGDQIKFIDLRIEI